MVHIPVMVEEVMEYLQVKEGGTYIDATAGGGGHMQEIIQRLGGSGNVIGIDQSKAAVEYLKSKVKSQKSKVKVDIVRGNFKFIEKIAKVVLRQASADAKALADRQGDNKGGLVDGVLFDLGFSSDEIQEKGRGFSFEDSESLDMRYSQGEHGEFLCECHTEQVESRKVQKSIKSENQDRGKKEFPISNFQFPISLSAKEVVNTFSEKELADLFWKYGDERRSRFFAKKIVEYRRKRHIESAMELAYVIGSASRRLAGRVEAGTARPTFESFQTLVRHAHSDAPDGGSESRLERRLARPQDPAPSRADSPEISVVLNQHFQNGQRVRGRAFSPTPALRRISSPGGLHPATKVFMALRIFVNNEFENIEKGLEGALNVLKPEGRCVIISFHSGEDRIVKKFITQRTASADAKALADRQGDILNLTKHVVKPSREEVLANRLSRSGVMRAFEKI